MEKLTKERAIEFILESIDLLRKQDGRENPKNIYLCTLFWLELKEQYTDEEKESWKEFIVKYYNVAEEKFAGKYWNKNIKEEGWSLKHGAWWGLINAENGGNLQEVYALKIKFLEHILEDIQK